MAKPCWVWPSPNLFGSLNKNHAGFRDFWLHCFYPYSKQFPVQIKVSTISASTLLLALPSGIIIHIVQFSRCAFQPLLRSDFSIQIPLGTEIRSHKLVGQSGLEPPTSRLSVVCSSQLSYWPSSPQSPLGSLASPLQFKPASLGFELVEGQSLGGD